MGKLGRTNYEADKTTFPAAAYRVEGEDGIAWRVRGWETAPDEDTEWSGIEERTGRVVVHMIGDDWAFTVDPEDLTALERAEYCSECGQIGCGHDGLDRSEGIEG